MTSGKWPAILFFLLCSNGLLSQADLMDMISEASCAARCFRQFTESFELRQINQLDGPDKLFLQQRPDLTQPHCINQKGECALGLEDENERSSRTHDYCNKSGWIRVPVQLRSVGYLEVTECLEICQWPRSHTKRCQESCKEFPNPSISQFTIRFEPVCNQICTFARDLYARKEKLDRGELSTYCPRVESWPAVCYPTCQTDNDCLPLGSMQKCCSNSVCPEIKLQPTKSNGNGSQSHICTLGVPAIDAVPLVPGQPAVKQVEIIPDPESASVGLQTTVPQQYQVELDWLDYYNRTAAQAFGWSTTYYPAVFLVQLRLFHDPSASVDFFEHANPSSLEPSSIADRLFGEWRNLVWTTKLGAVLSDLTPGTWYQFRLLALSSEGHGGWGQPSWPIRVRTRPEPPMSPRNLTEAKTRIFENNVDVTINWQSPKIVTHPLKKYQVTWRRYYGFHGDDRSSFTEYEANVPTDKTTYTIQNLKPATSYKIEVKAVSVFEGKELKSHPISLYLNTIPIPSKQSENDHSFNVNDTCSCRDKTHPEITVLRIYHENQQLKATIRVNLESETQRRKQYVIDWVPRVCIESQSNTAQDDYVPQRQTVRGSELSMVTLDNLRFQCHYKVIIKPTSDRKESTSHREWFACFCTPSCQSVFLNSNTPPPNCPILGIFETMQPMQLTYTVFPESQTAMESARNSLIKTDSQQISSAKTYNAVLKWAPLPVRVDVESKRSFRALNNVRTSKHTSASSIRGVRVTWGPRIYEPVALEAYQNGLFPHLDPESAQSKVVHPKSSTFILKGLERETLYIVHVQPIGDHSDGPTSTIFFAIPSTAESNAPTSTNCPVFWIAVFCVVINSYLNFL